MYDKDYVLFGNAIAGLKYIHIYKYGSNNMKNDSISKIFQFPLSYVSTVLVPITV